VQVRQREHRLGPRGQRPGGEPRELGQPEREHDLGQQAREPLVETSGAGVAAGLLGQPGAEDAGDLLERAVLQQPGEQQVAGLQQREVVLVVDRSARQQPGDLEVEQRGRDHQELGGALEVGPHRLEVGQELVGDLRERDVTDVELVLADQAEQQVEGAVEVVQVHREARRPLEEYLGRPLG
jgi:hypothetical protein